MKENKRQKAFTLIELLISLALISILMLFVSDFFLKSVFSAGNIFNQDVDLQNAVKSTVDNVQNTLKKATQTHLVGAEVYTKDMQLKKPDGTPNLDKRYSYIALRDMPDGSTVLANIVYNDAQKDFDIFPIVSLGKKDSISENNIKYNLNLYKNDKEYTKKMKNNILSITVTGISEKVNNNSNENEKIYELTRDIHLPNVNQILLSKFLKGTVDDITAIAYDNEQIKTKNYATTPKVSVVMVLDASDSMCFSMSGLVPHRVKGTLEWRRGLHPNSARVSMESFYPNGSSVNVARSKIVGDVINNTFLQLLNTKLLNNNVDVDLYIFNYGSSLMGRNKYKPDSNTGYIHTINFLKKHGMGIYNIKSQGKNKKSLLNQVKADIVSPSKYKMTFMGPYTEKDYQRQKARETEIFHGNTNTGLAILTGLEVLNQIPKSSNDEYKIFLLLTDGVPTVIPKPKIINRSSYKTGSYIDNDVSVNNQASIDYVKLITDPSNGFNKNDTFDMSYVIGFSGVSSDLAKVAETAKYLGNGKSTKSFSIKASDASQLENAFENIVNKIGETIEIFDGPNKKQI